MSGLRALVAGAGPRWARLSLRERLLLGGLAAAVVAYLVLAGAVRPLLAARADARDAIIRHEAALARLAAAPAGEAAEAVDDARPVSAVVTESAPEFELAIRRIEPEGAGVRLVLEDADFAAVLVWIEALEREHGLRLATIEMERRPEPGLVATNLGLAR